MSANENGSATMTGAQIVLQALADQGVDHIFGYPGGAVLPIYDELFQQDRVEHVLVRHEQPVAEVTASVVSRTLTFAVRVVAGAKCQRTPPRR